MKTKTVKGTLHKNTITTSIETIPVITYKGTPDCTGWFLLQETQFRYDTKWVVVEYVEEENWEGFLWGILWCEGKSDKVSGSLTTNNHHFPTKKFPPKFSKPIKTNGGISIRPPFILSITKKVKKNECISKNF